jgi:hypothetical protein
VPLQVPGATGEQHRHAPGSVDQRHHDRSPRESRGKKPSQRSLALGVVVAERGGERIAARLRAAQARLHQRPHR